MMMAGVVMGALSCDRASRRSETAPAAQAPPVPLAVREEALARGKAISSQAFALLSSNLLQAVRQSGVSNALPFCSAQAIPLTSLVARTNGVVLRRVSHKARNPANLAGAAELSLIQEYATNKVMGRSLEPVVLATSPATVTYYAPILIATNFCLQCHGELDKDLSIDHLAVIRRLYPRDEAIGFKLGDVRGLWRIDFQQDALVRESP